MASFRQVGQCLWLLGSHYAIATASTFSETPPSLPSVCLLAKLDLAHRWQMARTSAANPKHVRIEKICHNALCHSRSFANKTSCRTCGTSLETAYTLLPNQWPPLGVPPQVLALYDTGSKSSAPEQSAPVATSTTPLQDIGKVHSCCKSLSGPGQASRGTGHCGHCQDQNPALGSGTSAEPPVLATSIGGHLCYLGHPSPGWHRGTSSDIDASPLGCFHSSPCASIACTITCPSTTNACCLPGPRSSGLPMSRSGSPRGRRAPSTSSRGTTHTARTARTQVDTPSTTVPASAAPAQ